MRPSRRRWTRDTQAGVLVQHWWTKLQVERTPSSLSNSNRSTLMKSENLRNSVLSTLLTLQVQRKQDRLGQKARGSKKAVQSIRVWQCLAIALVYSQRRRKEKLKAQSFLIVTQTWREFFKMLWVVILKQLWYVLFLLLRWIMTKLLAPWGTQIEQNKLSIKLLWMKAYRIN